VTEMTRPQMYDVASVLKWGDKMLCGNRNFKKVNIYCVHIDTLPDYAVSDLTQF